MVLCAIWYHADNLKIVKNAHRGVYLKLQSATLLKVALLHECFSRVLNCISGTKLRKMVVSLFLQVSIFIALNYHLLISSFSVLSLTLLLLFRDFQYQSFEQLKFSIYMLIIFCSRTVFYFSAKYLI